MSNSQSRDVLVCDTGASVATAGLAGLSAPAQKLIPEQNNCISCSVTTKHNTIAAMIDKWTVCSVSVRDDFPQFATVIREHGHCGEDL